MGGLFGRTRGGGCHRTRGTHTIFHIHAHTQLCHTHTPSFFVTHHLSHTTLSHTTLHIHLVLLLDPPPPPLSFLPSPSPLQHLLLIIGRSCSLVGLSGPLIFHLSSLSCWFEKIYRKPLGFYDSWGKTHACSLHQFWESL